jgi:hypothetical protein
MSFISDAHNEWHTANGWSNGCPLDCAASQPPEPDQCGFCGDYIDAECGRPECAVAEAVLAAREAKTCEVTAALKAAQPQDDPWLGLI